ncbi:MAG: helicase HerA-like domain-containing protein [Christensenellales bacterium]|jgi:DNA helicase HerA-like ATPase
MLLDDKIWLGTSEEGPVTMLSHLANRHGLISGATGTGKTVTLQVMAEAFSQLGVPVFMADVKGDLAGLVKPGELNEKISARLTACGVTNYTNRAFPATFWDVFGTSGHPVRATVSEMGPLLLARMLQLNDTQAGVLHLVFRIADDEGMLLIDLKDLRAMLVYVGENAANYTLRYGNISKSSVGAIQRAIAVLEDQGGNQFFGEPSLDINDWFVRDENGSGMINILAADKLFLRPNMYSAFMLWMMGEIYELLPERGDTQLPQMVFFFDEAHLLFEDCPRELLERIELTIRLIRSKGVGVFFITQNPADVPSSVLSQLAARVQHALRAFTPQEQRVIKTVADTFRPNPAFSTEQAILSLGTGEALLSFLMEDGAPSVVQRAMILPPQSSIGAISADLRQTFLSTSDLSGKYDTTFDRESAYEMLSGKYATHGVQATGVLELEEVPEQPEAPSRAMFKVFNPQTGTYETREVEMPVPAMPASVPQVTQTAAPMQAPAVQERPPVLVYNAKTGQYEPQDLKEYRAPAPARKQAEPKKEKTVAQKMLDNFTRSTASGAGYQVGRSITRNILGVFGLK